MYGLLSVYSPSPEGVLVLILGEQTGLVANESLSF